MKKILVALTLLIASVAQATPSTVVKNKLTGLGVHAEVSNYMAQLVASAPKFNNNTYIKIRNAADTADLSVLKSDASDNTVLNAGTGKSVLLQVNSTTVASVAAAGLSSTGLVFPTANEEAVAGAGTVVGDAAALSATKHVHQITGANGTVGWKFATSAAGQFEFLLNTTAGVPKVYAASGGTCNGGAADAACTLVTGIVSHICYSTAADTWICA